VPNGLFAYWCRVFLAISGILLTGSDREQEIRTEQYMHAKLPPPPLFIGKHAIASAGKFCPQIFNNLVPPTRGDELDIFGWGAEGGEAGKFRGSRM
jgi:hypothetical protein